MALVPAYHSALDSDRKVYHDSSLCTEGNNIETNEMEHTGNARSASRRNDGSRVSSLSGE